MQDVTEKSRSSANTSLQGKWFRFLRSVKTGAVIFLTLTGYMAGVIYYSSYLQEFHIDDRMFPVDTFRYWVYGAFATHQFCLSIISGANEHFWLTALFAFGFVVYAGLMQAAVYPSPNRAEHRRSIAIHKISSLWKSRQRVKSATQTALVVFATIWSTGVLLFFIASVIGIPILVGREGARVSYESSIRHYSAGCERSGTDNQCSRLYDQDKLIAEGFVIAASPDQVALFNDGVTTILDLKGRRLITGKNKLP